jgi:hypothetical protein
VILQRETGDAASPATAFQHSFWWATGFTVIALVPALLLHGVSHPKSAPPRTSSIVRAKAAPRVDIIEVDARSADIEGLHQGCRRHLVAPPEPH